MNKDTCTCGAEIKRIRVNEFVNTGVVATEYFCGTPIGAEKCVGDSSKHPLADIVPDGEYMTPFGIVRKGGGSRDETCPEGHERCRYQAAKISWAEGEYNQYHCDKCGAFYVGTNPNHYKPCGTPVGAEKCVKPCKFLTPNDDRFQDIGIHKGVHGCVVHGTRGKECVAGSRDAGHEHNWKRMAGSGVLYCPGCDQIIPGGSRDAGHGSDPGASPSGEAGSGSLEQPSPYPAVESFSTASADIEPPSPTDGMAILLDRYIKSLSREELESHTLELNVTVKDCNLKILELETEVERLNEIVSCISLEGTPGNESIVVDADGLLKVLNKPAWKEE